MAAPLIRENIASLYEQIAARLEAEIRHGVFEPTGRLPSEAALCGRFGVSRVTVRLALGKLEQAGVVERKQGKGTYAAGKQVRHGLDHLRSFHESLLVQGLKAEMRLLSHALAPAPDGLAPALCDAGGRCLLLRRLHTVDGAPLAVGHNYLPVALARLDWAQVATQPAYALLQELTGHAVARAELAIKVGAADIALAQALGVPVSAPLLVLERSSCFADGTCCDRSEFYIRPERYEFVIHTAFVSGPGSSIAI